MSPIVIDRIQAFALSATPSVGPESSLGSMPVRNGVLLALTSVDGVTGWGEAWCNFPPRGNLSRLYLIQDVMAPLVHRKTFYAYSDCRLFLEEKLSRLARHTGEQGAFEHCYAAFDTAMADIGARMRGLPLNRFLTDDPTPQVRTYASTPNVEHLDTSLRDIVEAGHRAIKLKIGFDRETDLTLLRRVRDLTDASIQIMADANQNWSLAEAIDATNVFAEFGLQFIEEPLPSNAPAQDWSKLTAASAIPIAAGENITSFDSFQAHRTVGGLKVLQPDVAKWGGVSGCFAVGQDIRASDATCAMHYMGTALGLAASMHVLSAIGGAGPVELDANPNPLRTDLGQLDLKVHNGKLTVPDGVGIGFVPDPAALKGHTLAEIDLN
ncbi:mandelate racemase/muconate lactonizing enzyme family protein [Ruegeria atlantica]|uniref:mandelate racemase/muconate lactonizing enzyme family protein n=1 Tax=Ruegeria atlantica TaxID=81569 RepID=UPI00147B84BD|nr:mandelate racemase/muconate lactonizing enzyme family protein [Ruegeria atlantica]